jgi:hypothetical protein
LRPRAAGLLALLLGRARNKALFAEGLFSPSEIVENIKVSSWKWSMLRMKLAPSMFYEWCWDPGDCLLR